MDAEHNSFSYWNFTRSITFRFLFSYLVLYIWPFPLYFIPFSYYLLEPINTTFVPLVDAVGPSLLGKYYNQVQSVNGSGDTSFKYAQVFVFLTLAMLSTLLWSLIDRRRFVYKGLSSFLNALVRYYLAAALIGYGFQKIIPLQFPAPTSTRLTQTYGESSPMGLLWTFMGSSPLYVGFTGIGEVLAGALLLFRRTRLLGAIIAAFIMLHVFILNLSYDVPVKLYSFHLFFMSVFLLAPSAQRLINLFILNKPVLPEMQIGVMNGGWIRWFGIGLKVALIYLLFFQPLLNAIKQKHELDSNAPLLSKNKVSGKYEVVNFAHNKDTPGETTAESARWKEIQLNGKLMEITYMDGYSISWYCSILNGSKTIKIVSKDLSTAGEFTFESDAKTLSLQGVLNQDSIRIISKRTGDDSSLLSNRGFHWINEEPFYR